MYLSLQKLKMKRSIYFLSFVVTSLCFCQTRSFDVKVTGSGQPVIFLPGFTCPGEVWDQTIAHLELAFEAHQFTYAGFGDVPAIELPWYETLVKDINTYIERNDLEDVTLVGHSMGGMLAINLAASLPREVTRMILVDALPNIREVMMPQVPVEQIKFDSPYNQRLLASSDSAMAAMAQFMAQSMCASKEHHEKLRDYIVQSDRETYVYGYTELLQLDLKEQLKEVEAEVLILGADFPSKEAVLPNFENQYGNLKSKMIKIAPASRHFIMFDQPDWFYQEVNTFLE